MKKINFKKVLSGRNLAVTLFILAVVFLFSHSALAVTVGGWAGEVVGGLIAIFIRAIAGILITLVGVLMSVAAYSDFINAQAVYKGWIVVRDVCNMFFVVILLVIAFATILGQEEYGAKKMLPKLVMAAVLINFSKLICGLMIDVASVVMLTFVNAFSAIGAGNILDVLGISGITKINVDSETVTFSMIVSAYIFGLIYVIIATVVVAAMLGMLVMRIVMIWILVVLSPLAFFLQAVPGKGQQYASQWWSKWSSNLIVGPVLAFFLWLSFAALQAGGDPIKPQETNDQNLNNTSIQATTTNGIGSEAGTPASMAKFVIAIGMLLGGMKIAQEVGGETGSVLGKGMNALNKGKAMAISGATSVAKGTGKLAGRAGLGLVSQADRGIGKLTGVKDDKRSTWAGKLAKGWGDDLQATSKKNRKAAATKYLGKLGMGENTAKAGQEVINSKGFQTMANTVKGGAIGLGTAVALGAGAPIAIPAAVLAAVAGFFGSREKNKREATIKKYEAGEGELNQATADSKAAKSELDQYNQHQTVVDEFKQNEDIVANYKGPQTGFNSDSEEGKKFKASKAFIENKKNIADKEKSNKYLATNNLEQKEKAVVDAENNFKEKSNNIGSKEDYDKAVSKTKRVSWRDKMLNRFSSTKEAMADLTKSKDAARKNIKAQASEPTYWEDKNASRCPTTGLRKQDKDELEILDAGGDDADKATANIIKSINKMSGRVGQEWAKAIATMETEGPLKNNLSKIKAAFQGKTTNKSNTDGADYEFDANAWKGRTTKGYKDFDESKMELNVGSGKVSADAFAKNAAKLPADRNSEKNIMAASFGKINDKAKELGLTTGNNKLLDNNAGKNKQNDFTDSEFKNITTAAAAVIGDEIKALQEAGDAISLEKVKQLSIAKSHLEAGNFSGLAIKNSDVTAKGNTDSEKRINDYNSTNHELIHKAGATNEEATYLAADSLESAKLYGKIPQSNIDSGGQRYDTILGKLIANMEKANASQESINQAVMDKVESWKISNAERVVETENGQREALSDEVPIISSQSISINTSKLDESIDNVAKNLNDKFKSLSLKVGGSNTGMNFSNETKTFLRTIMEGAKKNATENSEAIADSVNRGNTVIEDKLSPLAILAADAESNKEKANDSGSNGYVSA